ncbi:hypothetical protein DL765_005770 [Monosporascus sp. GIB2]|nr:hypothetical protein DL765_005770 [Monosporascus sp. GIB2]
MKLRYRAPSGGGTLELDDTATVGQLLESIKQATGLSEVTVKYGWPPRPLNVDQADITLQALGLQRESFTVVPVENVSATAPADASSAVPAASASGSVFPSSEPPKSIKDQNISVPMPETGSTLVLRVMPDDNSCLFTAVGGALRGLPPSPDGYPPERLRRIIVDHIKDNPEKYNEAILGSSPDAYCARMLRPDTWGGAIELGIISETFGLEICSVDVRTSNVFKFGEGQHELRCVLVYSDIHYDRVAEVFVEAQEEMDFDVTRWAVDGSDHVLQHTKEMCRKLKEEHHYYTDTSGFVVMCNDCGWIGQGQKALAEHSLKTLHTNITEIQDTQ